MRGLPGPWERSLLPDPPLWSLSCRCSVDEASSSGGLRRKVQRLKLGAEGLWINSAAFTYRKEFVKAPFAGLLTADNKRVDDGITAERAVTRPKASLSCCSKQFTAVQRTYTATGRCRARKAGHSRYRSVRVG